jgi:hypothetical protein
MSFALFLELDLFLSFSLFSRDFSILTLLDLLRETFSVFDLLRSARSSSGFEAARFKVFAYFLGDFFYFN